MQSGYITSSANIAGIEGCQQGCEEVKVKVEKPEKVEKVKPKPRPKAEGESEGGGGKWVEEQAKGPTRSKGLSRRCDQLGRRRRGDGDGEGE